MIIAIDFDGTIVKHEYPKIGGPVPNAIKVIHKLQDAGHQLILYTMRSDEKLKEAVQYCIYNQIEFWSVNHNPDQWKWTNSRKVYAQLYIDDAALGCPLFQGKGFERDYVDWYKVEEILKAQKVIS